MMVEALDLAIALLTELEGERPFVYRDSAGLPSIGIGHLLTRDELRSGKITLHAPGSDAPVVLRYADGLTPAQIQALLEQDLTPVAQTLLTRVDVPLTDHQRAALVSFVFNIGCEAFVGSTLLKKLNGGNYAGVPYEMTRWVHAGGQVVQGLLNRRHREIAVWNTPDGEEA